jgi:uncharacterized membrane protein
MGLPWESPLRRWVEAGLLDQGTAERIRAWERDRPESSSLRWPARLALAFGAVLLGAGILLFVAAHWEQLGPVQRFSLVLIVLGGLHLAGAAAADRAPGLSAALHAGGTIALGGGIFLAGQIFHLQEHWPGGVLLWAIGSVAGWWLLRQWPQATFAAVLIPLWLAGEWMVAAKGYRGGGVLGTFVLLLALVYLGAEGQSERPQAVRRALLWLGGLALIPASVLMVGLVHEEWRARGTLPVGLGAVGWVTALGLPALVWVALRGRELLPLLAAAAWVVAGSMMASARGAVPYIWCAVLAAGVIGWGVRERRVERINLGIAGFALTLLVFYFSDVMDKLGRSASLIGLGLLFLGGGYLLEQARRRLVAGVREAAP